MIIFVCLIISYHIYTIWYIHTIIYIYDILLSWFYAVLLPRMYMAHPYRRLAETSLEHICACHKRAEEALQVAIAPGALAYSCLLAWIKALFELFEHLTKPKVAFFTRFDGRRGLIGRGSRASDISGALFAWIGHRSSLLWAWKVDGASRCSWDDFPSNFQPICAAKWVIITEIFEDSDMQKFVWRTIEELQWAPESMTDSEIKAFKESALESLDLWKNEISEEIKNNEIDLDIGEIRLII